MNNKNQHNHPENELRKPIIIKVDDNKQLEQINKYLDILLKYNKVVNLVSRRITKDELNQLINETVDLNDHIGQEIIIDAGSGNGLLGIPLAILNPNKEIFLIEPRLKKSTYLKKIVDEMKITNLRVDMVSIEEFLSKSRFSDVSIVSRGFPNFKLLASFIKRNIVNEVVLITSLNKIKKNQINMANVKQKTYNVALRTNLKILKMENVSRET